MKRTWLVPLIIVLIAVFGTIFSGEDTVETPDVTPDNDENIVAVEPLVITLITDIAGVDDHSFNQSAWEGLEAFSADTNAEIILFESLNEGDYATNLALALAENADLNWGVGYLMADEIFAMAQENPDVLFALVDYSYDETLDNLTTVTLRSEESAFLVGYIAGMMTETNKVGFIGGEESETIDTFEYGYSAGVYYAANELGQEIEVVVEYADSFSDIEAGESIATAMYADDVDIIFHAAGAVGDGVAEAAIAADKYMIGVDRDQSDLAPDNVLTSAIKNVGEAIYEISTMLADGEDISGQYFEYGLEEGCTGIADSSSNLVPEDILTAIEGLETEIIAGDIVIPTSEAEYQNFLLNF